jgi:hypothetical protein
LVNPVVKNWIINNKNKYDKFLLISASPDFFVKKLISPLCIFDEIYGSIDVNLKGKNKLIFIQESYNNNFCYLGDSKEDNIIFKHAKEANLIYNNRLIKIK